MTEHEDYYNYDLKQIVGKTLRSVDRTTRHLNDGYLDDEIIFVAESGERWRMYYSQDCCASCVIEDIVGDLSDLVDSPILMAEASTNSDNPKPDSYSDSFTWTFYKFATVKGYVTIRWYGSSNGYYSEKASFVRVVPSSLT